MRNKGIIRLLVVFALCLTVIIYNINGIFEKNIKTKPLKLSKEENLILLPENEERQEVKKEEEKEETKETTEKTDESKAESTLQASTEAIKGKVISRYISPYSAPLKYSNVYLKNNTNLSVDIKSLLESNLKFKVDSGSEPQVLIMHTHTTESFMQKDSEYYTEEFNSRNTDNSKNMVKIGTIIADKLNNAGIVTLHDKTQHDNPQYTGSYSRAASTIRSYLQKYPSIKIVLDLHRDAVSSGNTDKVKLVTEIEGKKAAQVMLVMGSQSGTITDYPNWQENLKLAVKLHQKIETKYPTLARPILLMSKKYNQNLTTGSLLIEFGTDVNTLEEVCFSAEMVGNSLAELLGNL